MLILTLNMKVTKIVQKHFLCTFWGFLVTIICDVKIDISMCKPHVNLFFLWTSSTVHVFDFLTFDILTSFLHMGNGTLGQMGIMVNTEDRDGAPWGMGHMGDGACGWWGTCTMGHMGNGTHGQWGTWTMGHMGKGVL